jgi:hypothetical protein
VFVSAIKWLRVGFYGPVSVLTCPSSGAIPVLNRCKLPSANVVIARSIHCRDFIFDIKSICLSCMKHKIATTINRSSKGENFNCFQEMSIITIRNF